MSLELTNLSLTMGLSSKNGRHYFTDNFVGNRLSVHLMITPNLDRVNTVIGIVTQHFGSHRCDYQIRASQSVLVLSLPETNYLSFFPISTLYDEYGIEFSYATVESSMSEPSIVILPENIALLPAKVAALETAQVDNVTYFENIETILTSLENANTSIVWDAVTGKPSTFPPSSHSHSITDITGLADDLALINIDLGMVKDAVTELESTTTTSTTTYLLNTTTTTTTTLESNKSYLATVADLVCSLPSTPTVGNTVKLSTGNFSLKVLHGNSSQQVLNNNTFTTVGVDNGIVLKPYSSIELIYLGANLWVSTYRARTINNVSALSVEPTANSKAYTPASTMSPDYSAVITSINNGVKTVGGLTNGFLSSATSGGILLTLSTPIILSELRLWNGQGNVGSGAASVYKTNDITVYAGSDTSGENLGTYTFDNSTATEQIKTVTPNSTPSSQFFLSVNTITPNIIGIIEIELWGKAGTGGEVTV